MALGQKKLNFILVLIVFFLVFYNGSVSLETFVIIIDNTGTKLSLLKK